MRLVDTKKLIELQNKPDNIRNICIIAHVDHGKTTLADSLVASNGIISPRMAGKLRYLDSRKDEQERGITMKSSAITLYYNSADIEYLVNLIDSPGHVDFSSEVSTAIRLCDGAIVIVDVVEGVCAQTKVALRQAWIENIQPVLVLNKMDRLITEMQLSPLDAYVHLTQILEQVNAILGELFTMDVHAKTSAETQEEEEQKSSPNKQKTGNTKEVSEWASGLEDADDENLYFSPEKGNVVFASAVDGWGFRVKDFAKVLSEKLGVSVDILNKTLWGDFYLNSKTKRIMRGAQMKAKKPLFVQMVLENLWSVYENIVIRKDKEKLQKIVDSLKIKLTARDMRHTDPKVQLQAVCSQWLPLAAAVLDMCCEKLAPPTNLNEEKVEKLMCSAAMRFDSLPPETQKLKEHFIACSSKDDSPVIVFISKMFPVERALLPENKAMPLTQEELALRREQARQRHAERMSQPSGEENVSSEVSSTAISPLVEHTSVESGSIIDSSASESPKPPMDDDVFIAFARVFSGKLRVGQELYVLGPKHNPSSVLNKERKGEVIVDSSLTLKDLKHGQHITRVKVSNLYLLMGRDLQSLDDVPAGNVLGIGGLEEHVLKSCTLSSTVACPSFTELQLMATPILRVAVMPKHATDMPALVRGLRLLNQADSCVQVLVQETGEHVIVTAGEVHLQRCLDDLTQRYAKIEIKASEPIVPFRETIVPPPTIDMVNEIIQDSTTTKKEKEGLITLWTANQKCCITINAVPLPSDVVGILESNSDLIKTYDQYVVSKRRKSDIILSMKALSVTDSEAQTAVESESNPDKPDSTGLAQQEDDSLTVLTDRTLQAIDKLKKELEKAFEDSKDPIWHNAVDKIWSFGPRRFGSNILLNRVDGLTCSFWDTNSEAVCDKDLLSLESSFVNGFQLATLAGPLCDEPMMGVAFVVSKWELNFGSDETEESGAVTWGPLSGQIMSCVKECCRKAFQAQPQRLMAAMYSCNIQVTADALGRMYGVLNRRHGRVLAGDMAEGSGATFNVTAVLPVVESFDFAAEIRKQTSGQASPQLVFSHWEVIDLDPFWVPSTEEEYLHFGEKADSGNRSRQYMDQVRRRKGLPVTTKIVEHAEKQRTLSKNK